MRWPTRRPKLSATTDDPAPPAATQELVTLDAGQVTLTGPLSEVRHALAVGLYGEPDHAKPMSKDEDHVMTGVYIGVGLLLAAGAGYLAWRYLLTDETKTKARDMVADGATKARRAVRDAKGRILN